jgi:SAM-dependent methyltransferase
VAKPTYKNHAYYIAAGWSDEPKERFKAIIPFVERDLGLKNLRVLDVGCATGELLGFLGKSIEGATLTGVDVSEDLFEAARTMLPQAEFRIASAIDLPKDFDNQFDLVTSIGCMSIFDHTEINSYWSNLISACRPGGLIVVLAPMNEFGVDVMVQHRKRMPERTPIWETGWNIFSLETIHEILAGLNQTATTQPFQIPFAVAPHADPVKTWTTRFGDNEFQLTNGLKLLINHHFVVVKKV